MIRRDQDCPRKAGNQNDRPDLTRPEADRAKRRKGDNNRVVDLHSVTDRLGVRKTQGGNLDTGEITAANAVLKQQAIRAVKENQATIHHP